MKYELYDNHDQIITNAKYNEIYKIFINNCYIIYPEINKEREEKTLEIYKVWHDTILNTPDYYILIAYLDKQIVGFIAFRYIDNYLCLAEVHMAAEYQGKNLLKIILKELINISDQNQYQSIYGTIERTNLRSQEVFKHLGLVETTDNRYETTLANLKKVLNIKL
jgi:L-amino acid N-acyltransferase YncA